MAKSTEIPCRFVTLCVASRRVLGVKGRGASVLGGDFVFFSLITQPGN